MLAGTKREPIKQSLWEKQKKQSGTDMRVGVAAGRRSRAMLGAESGSAGLEAKASRLDGSSGTGAPVALKQLGGLAGNELIQKAAKK